MLAIQDTMALIAHSTRGTNLYVANSVKRALINIGANVLAPLASHPALLNWQGVCAHPEMDTGPELCQCPLSFVTVPFQKGHFIVRLCMEFVRPSKSPQVGAKLGILRRGATR